MNSRSYREVFLTVGQARSPVRTSHLTPILGVDSNYLRGKIGPPTTDSEDHLPAPLQPGSLEEGWVGRVAHGTWGTFEFIARTFLGL